MSWSSELFSLLRDVRGQTNRPRNHGGPPRDPSLSGLSTERLADLIEEAVNDDDDRAALAPGLDGAAAELAARRSEIPPAGIPDFAMLLAVFHGSRWSALPDGEDDFDFEQARRWFAEVERTHPERVPEPFRSDPGSADALMIAWQQANQRAERSGREQDLRAAADVARQLLCAPPSEDADMATLAAVCAAITLSELADATREPGVRDEEVAASREAMRRCPPGGEHRLDAFARLGNALLSRYEDANVPYTPDLDEVIVVAGRMLDACGPGDGESRLIAVGELAECHRLRANALGSEDDMEAAIRHHRVAISLSVPTSDDHVMYVVNQISALVDRGTSTGSIAHLREAVALGEGISGMRLHGQRDFVRHHNLGTALDALAFEIGDDYLAERALSHHRAASKVREIDDEHRAAGQLMLGASLPQAFDRRVPEHVDLDVRVPVGPDVAAQVPQEARAFLDESVAVNLAALRMRGTADHIRRMAHGTIAQVLRTRYLLDGRRSDLDDAVRHGETAVADPPSDDLTMAGGLLALAMALRSVHAADGDRTAAARACECWRRVADEIGRDNEEVLLASLLRGETALAANLDPEVALTAFETATTRLAKVAGPRLARADAERRLARWMRVGSNGAVAALRAGRPERAVELLEQGRAVLWNSLLDTRADLHDVRRFRPDLADEVEIRRRTVADLAQRRGTDSNDAEALVVAGRALDRAVADVREAGFAEFGAPPTAARLREHARRGPVVLVSATEFGSHALIVTAGGVEALDLPALTLDESFESTERYLVALDADRPDQHVLTEVHAWLWRAIAGPILDHLGYGPRHPDGGLPRVWWCPTGPLSLLPLHAAASGSDAVLDRVVSSYTATVRSLPRHDGGEPRDAILDGERALFVGMSTTPGQQSLAGVERERVSLEHALPAGHVVTIEDERATRERVRHAWTFFPVVHFSGHGAQMVGSPSDGGLLLHDGMLTIAELADLPTASGRLAMLSACQTATGGVVNIDEAITVASALQYGGWDAVLGTLWPVLDGVAADLYDDVHRAVLGDRAVPAHLALHAAVRDARERFPDHPSVWAPFVHIGV